VSRSGGDAALPGHGWPGLEALERLHEAALEILARTGVRVRDAAGADLLARSGARVEGDTARLPSGLVEQALASVPRKLLLPGRAPGGSFDLEVAPGSGLYGNGTDTLYFRDAKTGARRRGVLADVAASAAACELLPNIDFVMSGVLPEDAPLDRIDLAQFAAMLQHTRKPLVIAPATAGETVPRMLEMAALAGEGRSFAVLGMTNPPLALDESCLGKARACGAAGVPFICAPGSALGTTAPLSIAGAVAVGHAETLAALVVHQLANPGAPFIYGTGAGGAFDMRTFIDVWAAPEGLVADAAACHLAAMLGLPSWSYAGVSDAKTIDGRLAAEIATTTLWSSWAGSSMYHDVGEFESGAQNSIESLVLGDAVVGHVRSLAPPMVVDAETLQLDDIDAVGPGGTYLARPYTRAHCHEMWASDLFDMPGYDAWTAAGSPTLEERLHAAAGELVARGRPVVDDDVAARLVALAR